MSAAAGATAKGAAAGAGKEEVVDMREQVIKALTAAGAPEQLSQFFGEAVQYEYNLNKNVHNLCQKLKNFLNEPLEPKVIFSNIQVMIRSFKQWKQDLQQLATRAPDVPTFTLDLLAQSHIKALCKIQAGQVLVKPGDDIVITDTSLPNRLKVKTPDNSEGYVRMLTCLLPSPDLTALTAVQRLRVQLLALWTESVKTAQQQLNQCILDTMEELNYNMEDYPSLEPAAKQEKVLRWFSAITSSVKASGERRLDLHKLHDALLTLEGELTGWSFKEKNSPDMAAQISALDKAVLCYQLLHKQWGQHRRSQETETPPLRVLDKRCWQRKTQAGQAKRNIRYYEYRTVEESVATKEEITYIQPAANGSSTDLGSGSRTETVETDQITHTQSELRRKFVIRAVIDPETGGEISFQDAIQKGVIDQAAGVYIDKKSGETMPIPEAMNRQLIMVEFQTSTKSKEETSAIGLITIKTLVDNRKYTVKEVIDASTGEKVDQDEAYKRGLITDSGMFKVRADEEMPMFTAIQEGWINVEYDADAGEPKYEAKTYAVNAVVDQRRKKKVQFYEAVKIGLIDKESGNYINNETGEKIYVGEAIRRGFLKAKIVDNTDGLNIDAENKMVVGRMDLMRKNVLKRVSAIGALKKAAGLSLKMSTTTQNGQNGQNGV